MIKSIFTAVCAAAVISAVAAPQPVGYWKMNDGEGDKLKSSVANVPDGTVRNLQNTKWVEGRKGGKALYFAGDPETKRKGGHAILPTSGIYDNTKPFTISFWAKPESTEVMKTAANYELVSDTKSDKGPGFRICLTWNIATVYSGDGKKLQRMTAVPAKFPVKRSTWNHIAAAYDGKEIKFYINGALARTQQFTVSRGYKDFCIGSYRYGYAYNYLGAISDVKFYNVALTAEQVMAEAKDLESEK